jgi:hypothetical protein
MLILMDSICSNILFAQANDAAAGRAVYELSRLREFDDFRVPVAVLAVVVIAVIGVVWYLYRRDAAELPRPVGVMLALLRLVAFAGLVVYFLGIERRATREVIHNSQVAVLVDVSQSMGLPASDAAVEAKPKTRLDEAVATLAESPLITTLRQSHDVNIARFDRDVEPVAMLKQFRIADFGLRIEQNNPQSARSLPAVAGNPQSETVNPTDWTSSLQPRGVETRLGQALDHVLRQYREAPLAGVIIISDGAQNAGVEPSAAVQIAKENQIPFYTIGTGSTQPQRNVAVRDLVLPTRAFPGDTLDITGYLQANGYANRAIDVELHRRRTSEPAGSGAAIATRRISLGKDGEIVPVTFNIEPDQPGTFIYQLRAAAPADDANARDNAREAEVDVIDRKTRVLLFASGPMRDYQYLRNQLHRDKSMTVDVLLQSAQKGLSQDANKILAEFPTKREDLFTYDCIVAFDPDWSELDATQAALLESWVAEEAGGLIVVAGSIHTAELARSAEHAKLRDLYPVAFQQRFTLMDDGQYGGKNPWPLELERAGREAKFLWLEKTADESAAAWDRFPGVYGYFDVRSEKPGAVVYARFSDPQAAGLGGARPVYLASQFYGAGQVFYIGSGEMWRLRSVEPAYFEVLYTKLVRHVSQGRILRGSSRGALLVERDRYELGETVVLRARLADAQHNPLTVDSVTGHVLRPDGESEPVTLAAEAERPGMYLGQLTVLQEGTYQAALSPPGDSDEPLGRYLQVRVPDRERKNAERNETLLTSLAVETGGQYYPRLEAAAYGDDSLRPLGEIIGSRAEVQTIKGTPDKQFAERQMHWLLAVVAGALFLEWIVRRLNRLA